MLMTMLAKYEYLAFCVRRCIHIATEYFMWIDQHSGYYVTKYQDSPKFTSMNTYICR